MTEPIHIISLGAGVQSSTMALMAAAGEITPMPTAAIFADTQAEPQSVYTWLDWLEKQLPFPVVRVTKGSLTDVSLEVRGKKDGSGKWVKSLIPAFIKQVKKVRRCAVCHTPCKSGNNCEECGSKKFRIIEEIRKGMMGRACTFDYKVKMLEKESRRIGGITRGQKAIGVIQWIGISYDECHRMKPSRVAWAEHRWPLIDLKMTRYSCLRWMEAHGFPKPPRSACIYCPFHSDAEWRRLRDHEPQEWKKIVAFEKALQLAKAETDNQRGVPFLHSSMKPISEVDLSTSLERGQGELFGNECEGMCGV